MKGLFLKELYSLKKSLILYPAIAIIYGIIGLVSNNTAMSSAALIVISTSLPTISAQADEVSRWNTLVNTMPVSRKTIVLSKYLFMGIMLMGCSLVILVLTLVIGKGDRAEALFSLVMITTMGFLLMSVNIPVLIKFGVQRARGIAMILLVVIMTILIASIGAAQAIGIDINKIGAPAGAVRVIAGIAAMVISFNLAVKFYSEKEF